MSTILITGASAGIGRDTAIALARAGHHVIAAARRLPPLEALREHGNVTPLVLDLDDAASIAAALRTIDTLTAGAGVDALVNNAGFATAGALAELSDQELRAQFETNVFGLMSLTRGVLAKMIERSGSAGSRSVPGRERGASMARGAGRIVNISSVSGRTPAPILGAYHATKHALEALSDALRMEVAAFGIKVVIVEPGTIRTDFAARTMTAASRANTTGTRYGAVYARADELAARFDRVAGTTAPVVRAIEKALFKRSPRARYVAPWHFAIVIKLINALPTAWTDAIMRRVFRLNRGQLLALQS